MNPAARIDLADQPGDDGSGQQQHDHNVGELVREQVLLHTRQEVPHAVDVRVDEFKVRSKKMTYIHATVIVERDIQVDAATLDLSDASLGGALRDLKGGSSYGTAHID